MTGQNATSIGEHTTCHLSAKTNEQLNHVSCRLHNVTFADLKDFSKTVKIKLTI